MHISEFKPGDIITRTQPTEGGATVFMDAPYMVLGIETHMFCIQSSSMSGYVQNSMLKIPSWGEGWERVPASILEITKPVFQDAMLRAYADAVLGD